MKRLFLVSSLLLVMGTALAASLPNAIKVSGITTPSGANGVYVLSSTTYLASTDGSSNSFYYWTLTSGSTTYYLYCHQYSGTYFWNIDTDMDDTNVLFYNTSGLDAASLSSPSTASPVGITQWTASDVNVGSPVLVNAETSPTMAASAINITSTSARIDLNITDLGYATITDYGVQYTASRTSITNDVPTTVSATGHQYIDLTGLTPNTSYSVSAYATNKAGTAYSRFSFTTSVSTGINETVASSLSLYPNPTTDGFYVNASDNLSTLSIYNLNGASVLSKQIQGQTYVDVTSLNAGIYIVKIVTPEGTVTKKLTKK